MLFDRLYRLFYANHDCFEERTEASYRIHTRIKGKLNLVQGVRTDRGQTQNIKSPC